jgi:hypothetical protein
MDKNNLKNNFDHFYFKKINLSHFGFFDHFYYFYDNHKWNDKKCDKEI